VDHAQRAVASSSVVDDARNAMTSEQLLEADVALGHLLPDRIGMLLAAPISAFDALAPSSSLMPDAILAMRSPPPLQLLEPLGDRIIGFGLELLEGERLHLLHELVHADPLGERRIDIHRLARDAAALLRILDVMERAHVVQPVGQLDQQHADVVGHREQEFAQILGGALILALRFDLGELGHAVDQPRDAGAEQLLDLLGVATVSSTVSCRIAVAIVSSSRCRSVRMPATSIGWLK
jgi:hypothetical protein